MQYKIYQKASTELNNGMKSQSVQLAQQLLYTIISEITSPLKRVDSQPLQKLISHQYHHNYKVYRAKCYQQFSPNLCGYHAMFNSFCFLQYLNGGICEYDIQTGGSFWKFKIKVENFLLQMKRKYNLGDEWPWREKDIREGDFERTYNKICLQRFEQFSLFRKHENFYYLSHTWQFQYQNLIIENESRHQLSEKIEQFRKYNGRKPIVLHLMLGITTHWTTFIAMKKNNIVQYWYIDSHNNPHLDFSWKQIVEFIEKKSQQRAKFGKPRFTNFQKQSYSMCIKDIQTSLKLLVDCLEGNKTLQSYVYNQKFCIFADPLQAAMAADLESVSIVVKEYRYNIQSFFLQKIQWHLLNEMNKNLMKSIIELGGKMKNYNQEGKLLYSITKRQTGYL